MAVLNRQAVHSAEFRTPGPYRLVRHPLYVGWLLVAWAAPVMTSGAFGYAIGSTAYILIAIQFEERDLVRFHPEYAEYRRRVPMILPVGTRSQESPGEIDRKLTA